MPGVGMFQNLIVIYAKHDSKQRITVIEYITVIIHTSTRRVQRSIFSFPCRGEKIKHVACKHGVGHREVAIIWPYYLYVYTVAP